MGQLRNRGQALPRWLWIVLAMAVLGWWFSGRQPDALAHAPGVLAPGEPVQGPVRGDPPERIGGFRIHALHSFALQARVLGREDYRFGTEAELSPTDLALGWGRMSDSAVLERLDIGQGGRFYHYRWGAEGPPIPAREIVRSSANMHLIPADAAVASALKRIVPGQVLQLQGWLVRAERDNWSWASSTTREDSGAGACELVLVTALWPAG